MPCQATETIVRVVGDRIQGCDIFLEVSNSITIGVAYAKNAIALSEIDPAIGSQQDLHRRSRSIVEHSPMGAIGIEDEDLIEFRSRVTCRAKMRMACDNVNTTIGIDIDACGSRDLWRINEKIDMDTRNFGDRSFIFCVCSMRYERLQHCCDG
jgi:hypothetical protein